MKYIVLDDFPPWSIYVPALVVLLAFLFALTLLLRALRRAPEKANDRRGYSRSIRPLWFLTIASAAALWFMVSSMFLRFHAVGFDPLHLELYYLWPQPSVVIDISEVVDVKLSRGARTCGHLEIATRQELYSSVNFKKCAEAEAMLKELPLRGHR